MTLVYKNICLQKLLKGATSTKLWGYKQFVSTPQHTELIAAWMNSAEWRWKMFSSYCHKEELNSFIAGGIKELLSLSVKQGGERSLAMNVFPCLAMVLLGARWLLQSRLLRILFTVFHLLLERLKFIGSKNCCVKLTGWRRHGYFEVTFIFLSQHQPYLLLLYQML